MPYKQNGKKIIPSVVFAFGLLTMSSNYQLDSFTTVNNKPQFANEIVLYPSSEERVSCSSLLFRQSIGDIIVLDDEIINMGNKKTVQITLKITSIRKHIPIFDFEEEYEEIWLLIRW